MADMEEKNVEDIQETVENTLEEAEAAEVAEAAAEAVDETDAADGGNEAGGTDAKEGSTEDSEKADTDNKKKVFNRKNKKDKKDKKDIQIEELNDRLMRLMAEYDNYRKRTDREKSSMYEMGAKSIVEKMLPIIDNFERGFDCVTDEQKEDPFVQGMDKVYSQMMTAFAEAGVVAIEAVGQEFDPNIHNAVMHVDDESVGDSIVVEEFQKGYMYRDTLVRCSMVKVAN